MLPVDPDPALPGQESVWRYPRPPRAEPTWRRIRIATAAEAAAPLICSEPLCVIDSLERVSQGQSVDGSNMPGHLRWHLAEHTPTQVETDPHVPLSTALVPPSKVRWTEGRGQLHPTVSGTLQGQH